MPTGLGPIIEVEPDVMLDDELAAFDPRDDAATTRGPEWWLCYAILKDVADLLDAKTTKHRAVLDALAWLSDPTEDAQWYFTFEQVCTVIGVEAEAVRAALRRKAERGDRTGRAIANRHVVF